MNLGVPIAIGSTAHIYLYENKIVKVFKGNVSDNYSLYEANKQVYAHSCGLPVPEIYDVTEIGGKQAIIMEAVKGRTLGDMLTDNMDKLEYYINIFIEIQQKIHRIDTDEPELMSAKLRRQIESVQLLSIRQKSALHQKIGMISYEKRLCHGDFHLYNVLMTDDNSEKIIDWIDSSAGDIRADVYRTYLLYEEYSVELADMYLRHYCKNSGMSIEEVLQWAPIIAGARLSENVSPDKVERLIKIVNKYCPM